MSALDESSPSTPTKPDACGSESVQTLSFIAPGRPNLHVVKLLLPRWTKPPPLWETEIWKASNHSFEGLSRSEVTPVILALISAKRLLPERNVTLECLRTSSEGAFLLGWELSIGPSKEGSPLGK